MNKYIVRGALLLVTALTPSVAFAHPGHEEYGGFLIGFVHPFGGLDHMLAMVAVGLFAFQLGGRALWLTPVAFVTFMAVGGGLGLAAIDIPFVEAGICLSVVVLGALVALRVKWAAPTATFLAGAFAIFHGYAHGAEMPTSGSAISYAAGFVVATSLLHASGVATGYFMQKITQVYGRWLSRAAGGVTACIGVLMLAGQI